MQACGGDDTTTPITPNNDGGGGNDQNVPGPDTSVPVDTGVPDDVNLPDTAPIDAGPKCDDPMHCVVQIAAGGRHACALLKEGVVYCWGFNNAGQLGSGVSDAGVFSNATQAGPVLVAGLTGVTEISASSFSQQLSSTCGDLVDGGVACWGTNQTGELGLNATMGVVDNNPHPTPGLVMGLPAMARVDTGNLHSCATASSGDAYCWGSNQGTFQLGRGALPNNANVGPAGKVGFDGGVVSAIQTSPGFDYGWAITKTGTVVSWGASGGGTGQLGRAFNGQADPNAVDIGLTGVTQGQAGFDYSCVVAGGIVNCWGSNQAGQLGRGLTGGTSVKPGPISLSNKTATMVAVGGTDPQQAHACALINDGSVYCWGVNNLGAVGGTADAGQPPAIVDTPNKIDLGTGTALGVACGDSFSCALMLGGTVQCWGSNTEGTLGVGATDNNAHPKPSAIVKF